MPRVNASFEITGWDQSTYDEPADGPPLLRATVRKRFSGALEGESVAELLMCGQEGYVANERVVGSLEGCEGTFVLQHGAATAGSRFGVVVPRSGTGALVGLAGTVVMEHERIALDYELEP